MVMNLRNSIIILLAVFILAGCWRDKRKPGRTYVPDMNYTLAYDAYTKNPNFADGQSSQSPVAGTIMRGTFSDDTTNSIYFRYAAYSQDSALDYEMAGEILSNPPIVATEEVLAEGKRLYKIHCNICHGEKGDGTGFIVENEKFPAVPTSYFDPRIMEMPMGQMFHVLQYGRNMMGSYASQLSPTQRWTIIHYVKSLQSNYQAQQVEAEATAEANAETNGEGKEAEAVADEKENS